MGRSMRNYTQIYKYLFYLLIITICMSLEISAQEFSYSPDKPQAGKELWIKFNDVNEKYNQEEVFLIVYSVKQGILNAEEYKMQKVNKTWECKYIIPDTSKALGIKISSGNFKEDIENEIYTIVLYNEKGEVLKGSKAGTAYIISYGTPVNAKPDYDKAYNLYSEEFSVNTSDVKYYLWSYCSIAKSRKDSSSTQQVENILEEVLKNKEQLSEDKLVAVKNIYEQILKEAEKANEVKQYILGSYPKGKLSQRESSNIIYNSLSDIEKAKEMVDDYLTNFPSDETQYNIRVSLLLECIKQDKYGEAKKILTGLKIDYDDSAWLWTYGHFSNAAILCLNKGKDIALAQELNEIFAKAGKEFYSNVKTKPQLAYSKTI